MQINYLYKAKVLNVVDGDTVDVVVDLGFSISTKQRLRLLGSQFGVDTWEKNSKDPVEKSLALAGEKFTTEKVLDKDVFIITQKSDSFGRYLAQIIYRENGIEYNLGDELIKTSLAKPYKRN